MITIIMSAGGTAAPPTPPPPACCIDGKRMMPPRWGSGAWPIRRPTPLRKLFLLSWFRAGGWFTLVSSVAKIFSAVNAGGLMSSFFLLFLLCRGVGSSASGFKAGGCDASSRPLSFWKAFLLRRGLVC